MLEDDLLAVADRVAPPTRPDLADAVLARLDEPARPRRRWTVAVAAVATLVAALGFSPQVRAFAADLLERAGIVVSDDEPDAAPTPDEPLPSAAESDLERAAEAATFPLSAPRALGEPGSVTVVDHGRVVSMSWRDGDVVLDQFDGSMGPVFEKQIGDLDVQPVTLDGTAGWWIPGPHDLMYVDRDGEVVSATARLAGRTLIWERGGVTSRLEVSGLSRREAVAIARSVAGTS
ncbi:MAG: hypothetical protein ACRDO4_07380 [Nocardioides sp.]